MTDEPGCGAPSFATLQVQGGYVAGTPQNTAIPPIYQSNAYEFSSLAHARDLFALQATGNIYSRNANPTQAVFEQRVAALEGGTAAVAVASGQAASAGAILALASAGDHIVAAHQLYGGTVDLLDDSLTALGIEVTFVDQDDLDGWRDAVRPETKAFFAESITNPLATVLDVDAVAEIAHSAGVPLIIDNTVATPYLLTPGAHGADIVVHSATKFLGGHGVALGGVIVDIGSFDFGAEPERWPQFTRPYPRFGDLVLWDRFGADGLALAAYIRTRYLHDFGATLSAQSAFTFLQGIETLDLRMQRHSASALAVARFLDGHDAVARVHHPGLPSSAWHERAARLLPRGASAVFAFDLQRTGDAQADWQRVQQVVDGLQVLRLVANIGDARSLVSHPASMTHSHMTDDQLADAGICATTIRLSIGLEDPEDLIADLRRVLDALADADADAAARPAAAASSAHASASPAFAG